MGRAPYCSSQIRATCRPRSAVVDLLAVHCVRLQFFIRTEVIKTPVNNREIIFHYFFLLFFYWLSLI